MLIQYTLPNDISKSPRRGFDCPKLLFTNSFQQKTQIANFLVIVSLLLPTYRLICWLCGRLFYGDRKIVFPLTLRRCLFCLTTMNPLWLKNQNLAFKNGFFSMKHVVLSQKHYLLRLYVYLEPIFKFTYLYRSNMHNCRNY